MYPPGYFVLCLIYTLIFAALLLIGFGIIVLLT